MGNLDTSLTPTTCAEYGLDHEYWTEARVEVRDEATNSDRQIFLTAWANEADLELFAQYAEAVVWAGSDCRLVDGLDAARAAHAARVAERDAELPSAKHPFRIAHIMCEHLDAVWHHITPEDVPGVIGQYGTDTAVIDNPYGPVWECAIGGDRFRVFGPRRHNPHVCVDYIDPSLEGLTAAEMEA